MATDEFSKIIRKRLDALADWLRQQDADLLAEHKHLDTGSSEQLYWHKGYYAALNDVERSRLSVACNTDTAPRTRSAAPGEQSYH